MAWYKEGFEVPRFKSGAPSNSVLQGPPPFQIVHITYDPLKVLMVRRMR